MNKPSAGSKESLSRRAFLRSGALTGVVAAAAPSGFAHAVAAKEAAGSNTLKLSLASYTTRKLSLEKTIEIAKRVGLKSICLKSFHLPLTATADATAAAAAKVRAAGLSLYSGGVVAMTTEQQVNQAFDYARAAGFEFIVCAPSADMLPLIEKKVKEHNIGIAIHNHGPGDKHFPTPESAYAKIVDRDKRMGLCIDIGHTVRYGADPVVAAQKYGDRLYDVHLKDLNSSAGKGKDVPVGRGVIDIPQFLRTLVQLKYQGRVSFEYEADAEDPLPGLAESVGYTRGVLAVV